MKMINERKIVYMDWNTLKGIKDAVREPFISIGNLLMKYKDRIVTPYSPSHLSDLNKNYANNKEKIDSDLEFLKKISGDLIIAKYLGNEREIIEERDVIKYFHKMRNDKENETSVLKIVENITDDFRFDFKGMYNEINLKSILVRTEEFEKSESGKVLLKHYKSFFETGEFNSLLKDILRMNENFQNNPQDYNDFKKGLKKDLHLDANISNWESPIQQLDDLLPKTSIGKSFSELVIEDVNRTYEKPTFFDYYLSAYNFLGLLGFRPDKLTEKNRFNNTTEDRFHSFYGTCSEIFITHDKIMYYRSKVLFDFFEIRTKIYKTFKVADNLKLIKEIEKEIKNN